MNDPKHHSGAAAGLFEDLPGVDERLADEARQAPEGADAVLAAMRAHPAGHAAVAVGTVNEDPQRFVQMATRFGGRRMVDWLSGEQLPRIC